jgi:hypothetical protein
MNTFKKKSLYAALAGVSALGVTGAAQAVNVNPDGLGQVLIYPYYTTRADSAGSAYATLLSVVNSTASAKAVKVRFLEGKNSREVLDFNLFLSPFDVWTAAILPDTATGGARVGTVDRSCTLPAFSDSSTAPFISFVNYAYTGSNNDGGGGSLDRSKEGYFEIIEMATYASSSITGKAITHVNGVPPCGANLTDAQALADALPLGGGLFGSETLINVNSGTDYTADPTALDNFYQIGNVYNVAGSTLPDLTLTAPPVSIVVAPNGNIYTSSWSQALCTNPNGQSYVCSADPVSAVLMHNTVLNEYVLDSGTKSQTDWVVTMPTKRFYVNAPFGGNAPRLFQRNFNAAGSCDDVSLNIYDREERTSTTPITISPPPPVNVNAICWEANVITFNGVTVGFSNVLGSTNVANIPVPGGFQNGWLNLGFPSPIAGAAANVHTLINVANTAITTIGGGTTFGNTVTYFGLPVVGFAVVSYSNGTLTVGQPPVNVLSNYGGNFKHKNNTKIQ